MAIIDLIPTYSIIFALLLITYELERLRRDLGKIKRIAMEG